MRMVAMTCGAIFLALCLACSGGAPVVVKNPMSLKEYSVRRVMEPTRFVLRCSLHRAAVERGKDCWMILMHDPEFTEGVYGFVEKDSPAGKAMFEAVRDGKTHYLTVTIQHDDALSRKDYVTIGSVTSD